MRHLLTSSTILALVFGCSNGPLPEGDPPGNEDLPPIPDEVPPEEQDIKLMEQWAGCMTLDNWNAADMSRWAVKPATSGFACVSCHEYGQGGVYTPMDDPATPDEDMFLGNRYERFIGGFFTQAINEETQELEVVPAYGKLVLKGEGANNHPLYDYTTSDPAIEALDTFYELTRQAIEADQCPDTTYATPVPEAEPLPEEGDGDQT